VRDDTPEILQIHHLIDRFQKAIELLKGIEFEGEQLPPDEKALRKWIRQLERQRQHSSQKFTIMLLGEYNVGKSTLLNALLELPKHQRLPSADRPTNARPIRLTQMREGDPEARIIMWDGREIDSTWEKAIGEATTQLTGQDSSEDVREVQLFLEHVLLQQSDILDMPGTGTAWYTNHTEITHDYISNAEMIIWVVGADEPSAAGWTDFNKALKEGVPNLVVYNAWGFLDPQKDARINIDQDAIEKSVKKNFLAGAEVGESFRVYARKCLEAQERGLPVEPEWGLLDLRVYLQEKYLGQFLDRARARRERVLQGIYSISRAAHEQISLARDKWLEALERQGDEGKLIRANLSRSAALDRQIRSKIRRHAGECAQSVLEYISRQAEHFINDYITINNLEMIKSMVSAEGRARIEQTMSDVLRNDYLKLDRENNWFRSEINEFVTESWVVVEAEWRSFLADVTYDVWKPQRSLQVPDIPFDRIRRAALAGVNEFLARIVAVGAVVGILLLIPGIQIINAVATIVSLIGITLGMGDPFAKQRKNAIERVRSEMYSQFNGLRNDLVELVMSNNKSLQDELDKRTGQHQLSVQQKTKALTRGIEIIDDLRKTLSESAVQHA